MELIGVNSGGGVAGGVVRRGGSPMRNAAPPAAAGVRGADAGGRQGLRPVPHDPPALLGFLRSKRGAPERGPSSSVSPTARGWCGSYQVSGVERRATRGCSRGVCVTSRT